MKRFLYSASVTNASGWQQFYIDAATAEDADLLAAEGDTHGIYAHEVEVTDLDRLERDGETTVDDFGDFPPFDPKDAEIARLSAALSEALAQLEAERARNAAVWRPIKTAPRDGTPVLSILPVWNVPHVVAFENGYWHEQFSGQCLGGKAAPTHWQPMFAPPLAISTGARE